MEDQKKLDKISNRHCVHEFSFLCLQSFFCVWEIINVCAQIELLSRHCAPLLLLAYRRPWSREMRRGGNVQPAAWEQPRLIFDLKAAVLCDRVATTPRPRGHTPRTPRGRPAAPPIPHRLCTEGAISHTLYPPSLTTHPRTPSSLSTPPVLIHLALSFPPRPPFSISPTRHHDHRHRRHHHHDQRLAYRFLQFKTPVFRPSPVMNPAPCNHHSHHHHDRHHRDEQTTTRSVPGLFPLGTLSFRE